MLIFMQDVIEVNKSQLSLALLYGHSLDYCGSIIFTSWHYRVHSPILAGATVGICWPVVHST